MAPFKVVASRKWVCAGGLLALTVALGCGRSRRTLSVEGEGEGGAPDAGTGPTSQEPGPLAYVDFCLAQAAFWCERAAACCTASGLAVDSAPCYAERAEACRATDEPSSYDRGAAGECLRDTYAAWSDCYLREDAAEALTAAASCARVTPEELPALGEPCTGKCRQEANLTVFCDTRSDGAGSFRCEGGGKPSALDGYCAEENRCAEPGRCIEAHCSLPLEDGVACSGQGQCASGYCCDAVYCPVGSSCSPEGTPLVQPAECTRLVTLGNAVAVGAATRNFVTVTGDELWWNEGLEVWHAALDGGMPAVHMTLYADRDHPRDYPLGVVADATYVYYFNANRVGRFDRVAPNAVDSLSGYPALHSNLLNTSMVATNDTLYVASSGCRYITPVAKDLSQARDRSYDGDDPDENAGYLAVGSDCVYCVSDAGIYRLPFDGEHVERLATLDAWGGPAVYYEATGTLYFTNVDHQNPPQGIPALRAFHVADGTLETVMELDGMSLGLVLEESTRTLYFANGNAIEIHSLEPEGGAEVQGTELVRSLAQSTTDLYYLTDSGIFRLPKHPRTPMR